MMKTIDDLAVADKRVLVRADLNAPLVGSGAFTLFGGGDTGAAIHALGFPDSMFGYGSTGGGASLEFIQGKTLPGIAVLED